jgi:hypothetical protein
MSEHLVSFFNYGAGPRNIFKCSGEDSNNAGELCIHFGKLPEQRICNTFTGAYSSINGKPVEVDDRVSSWPNPKPRKNELFNCSSPEMPHLIRLHPDKFVCDKYSGNK